MKNSRFSGLYVSVLLAVLGTASFTNALADERSDVSELLRAGKLQEAMSKADQFLSSQPKDAQMRFLKGVIQRESGKTSDAIATFSRLTEEFPDLPEPHNNLAVLYAGQGQYDRARAALEAAIRTNPTYATAHENLGDVYAKLASQAYNKALQLDESNAAVGPKLALIKDLFSPASIKTQRQTALAPVPPPPQIASLNANKQTPSLPTLPPPKQPSNLAQNSQQPVTNANAGQAPAQQAHVAATPATQASAANAAAPAAAAAPVVVPAPAASAAVVASGSKDVEKVVRAWASAWSAKNVKAYLGFYGKDFDPPSNMGRSEWESERRARIIGKSAISVKIENLVVSTSGNKATARFRQTYKADSLTVSSRKVLELVKIGENWRIVKETVGN